MQLPAAPCGWEFHHGPGPEAERVDVAISCWIRECGARCDLGCVWGVVAYNGEETMILLVIVLILLFAVGGGGYYGPRKGWSGPGYYGGGGIVGIVVLLILVWLLLGHRF
jgi:hypothetical protein